MKLCLFLTFTLGLVLAATVPGRGAPYIVYQGSVVTSLGINDAEAVAQQAMINSRLAAFHKLAPALQKQILAGLNTHVGTTSNPVYMIVDEANMTLGAAFVADSSSYGGKVFGLDQSLLPAAQQSQNFISGFQYSAKGSVGILRLGISHATGIDQATGVTGACSVQFYGTGSINSAVNFPLAPKQAALTFIPEQNGVKGASITLPAFAPVVSSGQFIPEMAGQVFYFYFDDGATESVAVSSTHGTFVLGVSPALTALANHGGRYIADTKDIGYVAPVAGSDVPDMKLFIYNILGLYPKRF